MTETTDQIILGDQVQLKSGGPIMTVDSMVDGKLLCCWFSKENTPCAVAFTPTSLVKQ